MLADGRPQTAALKGDSPRGAPGPSRDRLGTASALRDWDYSEPHTLLWRGVSPAALAPRFLRGPRNGSLSDPGRWGNGVGIHPRQRHGVARQPRNSTSARDGSRRPTLLLPRAPRYPVSPHLGFLRTRPCVWLGART